MKAFIKKCFLICSCICVCLQGIPTTMVAYAFEKEKVDVSIDNQFLSEDLFELGYSFFYPEAIQENGKLTVYFRQLGKMKYEDVMISPKTNALASADAGSDWDAYTLPITTGKTTYALRIYSKVRTSYYWDVTLTVSQNGTVVDDADDVDDNTEENGTVQDGTYDIPVSFIQESSTSASMLDQYTYKTAALTITEEVYMLTLYINHWYDESANTQAVDYLIYQGTRASKVSSAKTIDGVLYDTFTLQLADLSSTQSMTAMVIPMENISAGFGTQNVRLVMDLSDIPGVDSSTSSGTTTTSVRSQLGTLLEATALLSQGSYTSASWSALQTAIATATVYYSNASATDTQLQAQITAVEEAIAGLVHGSSSTSAGLKDGTYTIKVSAIKAASTDTSMANQYLKSTADLVVSSDTYKLTVYFKAGEMNYLKYNGSKASVSTGSSYDGFTFTLANTEEYQTITVSVKQMEAINASLSVQSCRLVLDWDSVESGSSTVEEATTVATTEAETETETAADTLTANEVSNTTSSSGGGYRSSSNTKQEEKMEIDEEEPPLSMEMENQNVPTEINRKHVLQKATSLGVKIAGVIAGLLLLACGVVAAWMMWMRYQRRYQK